VFDSFTEPIKRDVGDARRLANLTLRVAGVLMAATVVFMALYFFVQALDYRL
jgi:hypothetical protein